MRDSDIEESDDDSNDDASFSVAAALDDADFNDKMSFSLRRHAAQLRLLEPDSCRRHRI